MPTRDGGVGGRLAGRLSRVASTPPLTLASGPLRDRWPWPAMIQRRDFLALGAAGSTVAATTWPGTSHALLSPPDHSRAVPEIFAPVPRPPSHSRALVIGSGFGGAVSALRLAQAGVACTVLERGFRWPHDPQRDIFAHDTLPDGRAFWFRNSSKTVFGLPGTPIDRFAGVMDVTEYPHIDVWRGACVGGGSVVFTGAMPQPTRQNFDAIFQLGVNYEEMNAVFYPRVRQMLGLSPMPTDIYNSAPFGHSRKWDSSMRRAGYSPGPVDGIWNWNVVRDELAGRSRASCTVGRSNLGNSNGAKFDLNQNYLKQAQATGLAQVYPGQVVKAIGHDGQRYLVDIEHIHPTGAVLARYTLTSDLLVLAAGSIGTTELLVRARARGSLPNLNEHIGTGWGSNGDSAVSRSFAFSGGLTTGAACASMVRTSARGLSTTLENWYAPGIPVNIGLDASLGMVMDLSSRAKFAYDSATDRVNLLWPANGNDAAVAATRAVNNRIALMNLQVTGVPLLVKDVYAGFTAHPLGGAVLDKATDNAGRVRGYRGLYVMDGAAIPGSTGAVNPALTISALAERNIARIIAAGG